MSQYPVLIIIEGKEKGKHIEIKSSRITIGRTKGDVVVPDSRISREHVELVWDAQKEKLYFKDLKSLNGTFLNGKEVIDGQLSDGDKLQVGDTVFDYQYQSEGKSLNQKEKFQEMVHHAQEKHKKSSQLEPLKLEKEDYAHLSNSVPDKKGREGLSLKEKIDSKIQGVKSSYKNLEPRKIKQFALFGFLILAGVYFLYPSRSHQPSRQQISQIQSLIEQQDFSKAKTKVLSLYEKYPKNKSVNELLGDLSIEDNKPLKAIEFYQVATKSDKKQPILQIKKLKAYLASNLVDQANKEYESVSQHIAEMGKSLQDKSKLSPEKIEQMKSVFIEVARTFLDYKRYRQSPEQLFLISKALQNELAPTSPEGYQLEALVLLRKNDLNQAEKALSQSFSIKKKDLWVIENLALARFRLKDYTGAEEVVNHWIADTPGQTKPLLIMSYLKFSQNQNKLALPYLEKILEIGSRKTQDPFYPEAMFLVSQVFIEENRNEEAFQFIKRSCDLGYQLSCQSPLLSQRALSQESPAPHAQQKSAQPQN